MKKRTKWLAAVLALALSAGVAGYSVTQAAEQGAPAATEPTMVQRMSEAARQAYWRALGIKTAPLQMRVVDTFTQKGIDGAGCVIGETGQRIETNNAGVAPVIQAPVYRHPRLEQMLAEVHGALTVICYKNGYRDAIVMGVRMHEDVLAEPEIWMTPIGPNDRRIEPTLYQMPIHRVWQVQLVDKYRLYEEEGEGPESPKLSRPDTGQAPEQLPMGAEPQTPIRTAPPPPTDVPDRPQR